MFFVVAFIHEEKYTFHLVLKKGLFISDVCLRAPVCTGVVCVYRCGLCTCTQEEPEGVDGDDADNMPEVLETVAVIPGSTLLWRISSRPQHSAQVTHAGA